MNMELKFLNIGKYDGMYNFTADFSDNPRPFFSIGMILSGKGDFCEQKSNPVHVDPGDIITVPRCSKVCITLDRFSGCILCDISLHFRKKLWR